MSFYPQQMDSFTTKQDNTTQYATQHIVNLQEAIHAIQATCGVDPAGSLTDFKTRIANHVHDSGSLDTAMAIRTTNQAITSSTITSIGYDDELWDTNTMKDPSVNRERITIKKAGIYFVGCHVVWQSGGSGDRQVRMNINGTTTIIGIDNKPASASNTVNHISRIWEFAANDFIITRAYHENTSAQNIQVFTAGGEVYAPSMWAIYLGE